MEIDYLITPPANYPAEKGGATGETSDLALTLYPFDYNGKDTNMVLRVWRRITAELSSWKTSVPTSKPVLTIEGYFGTSENDYLCGFSEIMMETEGNRRQSHLEITSTMMTQGEQQTPSYGCVWAANAPIIVDEQIDYLMDSIDYVSY